MKTNQYVWNDNQWKLKGGNNETFSSDPDLTLIFGDRKVLEKSAIWNDIKVKFGTSDVVTCSTSGSILGTEIYDAELTATTIKFNTSKSRAISFDASILDSNSLGQKIGNAFENEESDLKLLYLLSDGHSVNGSQLVVGINEILDGKIPVTGGLAGDEARFEKTLVGLNEAPTENKIIALGFYGQDLEVGYGNSLGWKPFGPIRKVTKSENNVLMEIDGKPALDLYKNYLGPRASELPGSALLFPFQVVLPDSNENLIRTPLSIDEIKNSITCAGDIPEGSTVQFMTSDFESLIKEAGTAAVMAQELMNTSENAQLALMVSCVGRRLVLGQMAEDEVDEASNVFGENTAIAGFYSYGEICPSKGKIVCQLHNETMTITSIREKS